MKQMTNESPSMPKKYYDGLKQNGKLENSKYNEFKEQTLPGKQNQTNTPAQLPSWVPQCLKNYSDIIPTSSPRQVRKVFNDHDQINYFFENGNFQITDKNIKLLHKGTWECQGDDYIIKTEDGDTYNSKTGEWSGVPQSQNTTTPDNTGTPTPTPTPRKRGNPLNTQDYEGINFKYKYPGDKNYRYGVKGTDWYAKNINNQKVFNISKDGFTSSVDKLNTQFPDAFKEVVQPITPTQDSTKVVTNVPPVKPVDSANTGTPVKPVDSANTGTNIPPQVKFVDSTTYKLEKI
jgi:hypothetical protein